MTSIPAGSGGETSQVDVDFSPGTLGFALQVEGSGFGAVRFLDGKPYWDEHAAVRFPAGASE